MSIVADLMSVVAEINKISGILDAISTIEHATDVLTQHGERTPFRQGLNGTLLSSACAGGVRG